MIICPATVIHFIASQRPDLDILARAMETEIEIISLPSSNRTRALKVSYDNGEPVGSGPNQIMHLFVKQPLDMLNTLNRLCIIREGFFYESVRSLNKIKGFFPNNQYFSINSHYAILLRTWIKDVDRFSDVKLDDRLSYYPHIGYVLGTFHAQLNRSQLAQNESAYKKLDSLRGERPSPFLSLGLVDDEFIQQTQPQLYNFIHNPYLKDTIDSVKEANAQWETTMLIHADLNENNILVYSDPTTNYAHIIDWEFVVWGDAAWDIATIIYHLIVKRLTIKDFTEAKIKSTFQRFWRSYYRQNKTFMKSLNGPAFQTKVMVFVGVLFYDALMEELLQGKDKPGQQDDESPLKGEKAEIARQFILGHYTTFFF